MIVFSLRCANGHSFDEWFASGAEYERRKADGTLECPTCGDHAVTKAVMAPRVNASARPAPSPCGPACAEKGCPFAH